MSTTIRQGRVAELLYEELSIIIGNELEDPRLSMVEVTQVEVSRDLRSAKVFVHHRQDEVSRQEVLKRLQRAIPFLRSQIAERCGLRLVPELVFHYDDSPKTAARVDELLRQAGSKPERSETA
jgi:ribosome-binding factor A